MAERASWNHEEKAEGKRQDAKGIHHGGTEDAEKCMSEVKRGQGSGSAPSTGSREPDCLEPSSRLFVFFRASSVSSVPPW